MGAGPLAGDAFDGRADDVYAMLVRAHHGLGDEESAMLNARLVLILASEVSDPTVLTRAVAAARRTLRPDEPASG